MAPEGRSPLKQKRIAARLYPPTALRAGCAPSALRAQRAAGPTGACSSLRLDPLRPRRQTPGDRLAQDRQIALGPRAMDQRWPEDDQLNARFLGQLGEGLFGFPFGNLIRVIRQ